MGQFYFGKVGQNWIGIDSKDEDIARTLLKKKMGGCGMMGTIAVTIDMAGMPRIARFDRARTVNVKIGLEIERLAAFQDINIAGIKAALAATQFTIGEPVYAMRLTCQVNSVPGFVIRAIAKKLNYGYTDFMSYSIDFRRRILSIKKHEGLSIRETAKRFHIGTTTIVRWTKQIDARPATSRQRKIDKSALERDVEQYPDAYQRERAERFGVCQMAICKALKKLQLTYKKNSASSKSRRRR